MNAVDTPFDPHSLLQQQLAQLAPTEATVLLTGETGTGKERTARWLHNNSARRNGPFLAINCGALSESLAEAELFGHEKGAFTGANQAHAGWFEAANGGTLLLDEIGELSAALQVKLLRVLQEREVTRIGARLTRPVNVRVIAATHRDLVQAMREKRFREDLWYRLNVASITLPPLRARPEAIPTLAQHFLAHYAGTLQRKPPALSAAALTAICRYRWPGNIRELENTLHRTLLLHTGDQIEVEHLNLPSAQPSSPAASRDLADCVRQHLVAGTPELWAQLTQLMVNEAMAHSEGNQIKAAERLGISRYTLRTQLAHQGKIRARRNGAQHRVSHEQVIRIGYQKYGNLGMLKAQQQLEQQWATEPVTLQWSEYPAGPQLLLALQNNEIDFGTTGDVPPVLAQASGTDLCYIGWEPAAPKSVAMMVPMHSAIQTLADLRGKRIAVNKGSNVHNLLLQLLDEAGLHAQDVRIVYTPPRFPLTPSDYTAADAWMLWDPLLSAAEQEGQLRVLADGTHRVDNFQFYLARRRFVEQSPALLKQILQQLQHTGEQIDVSQQAAAHCLAEELMLPEPALRQALARRHHQVFPMNTQIVRSQQAIADRFYARGLIPKTIQIRDAVWWPDPE